MFERSVRASEEEVTQNKETAVSTGLLINVSKRKHMKIKRNNKFVGRSDNQQTSI